MQNAFMKVKSLVQLDPLTQKKVQSWLDGSYDEQTKSTIRQYLKENPKELLDAFYTNLTFGTGGLRGIMGVGSNRMNRYTVGAVAQGLANYLNKQPKNEKEPSVLIGYDSRHFSREFAEESAKIFAGNGIKVFIFKELRPTPLVSFGCRLKQCSAAIMITASHNPPEYNGCKVYWNDGAQILPPHDKNIIEEVRKILNPDQVKICANPQDPLIEWVGEEIDDKYLKEAASLQNYPKDNKAFGANLKVVYTSLHGTGITIVPKILKDWGFNHITLVPNQTIPDGNFTTVQYPNPEEKEALQLGIDTLIEKEGDLLIATDPDCDRLGIAIRDPRGKEGVYIFTGNQIACLCLNHVCEALIKHHSMPAKAAFVKTVVTTELFQMICNAYQKPCFNVLTGFKYIAEKIREWEQDPAGWQFIFGGEESYGYLLGTFVRDKDAVLISALLCEAAAQAKKRSETLLDILEHLYRIHGYYFDKLLSIKFEEGKEGREQMAAGIKKMESGYPELIAGIPVKIVENYQTLIHHDLSTQIETKITRPKTDMLVFWLEDDSKLVIRPSGTEPRIKIYCGIKQKNFTSLEHAETASEQKANRLVEALAELLT
jgi:phosphomannomutase